MSMRLLSTLGPRDRRALLLGSAVLLPALLWVAAVRPYRAKLSEVREQVASERALLEREQLLLARAETMPEAISVAETAARRAELRLVRAPNTPLAEAELSSYLESIAGLSRVLLRDMRGMELRRNESYPAAVRPIRLAVTGESDLIGVINFMNSLEGSPLLIRIRDVMLQPVYADAGNRRGNAARRGNGTGGPTGVMQFSLTLEAYAPAETTAVETPATTSQTKRPDTENAQ